MTKLTTKTSAQQDQVIYLYTVAREAGLWYLVLAAAPSQLGEFDPVFRQMGNPSRSRIKRRPLQFRQTTLLC